VPDTARFTVSDVRLPLDRDILTIDFENWHQRSCVPMIDYLLDELDAVGATATFFVVGARARGMAGAVRAVHARGHEIASHGWLHRRVGETGPAEFRDDVRRSLAEIADITGAPVRGFRAPFFSVVRDTVWALEILAELGLGYDSSVFPIAGRRYGIAGFPRRPVRLARGGAGIVEVPLSTVTLRGRVVPVAGGGYFRLMPYPVIRSAVRRVHDDGRPFVAYFHPYEFDPQRLRHGRGDHPGGRCAALRDEACTNFRRRTMRGKLSRLLSGSQFTSIGRCLEHAE
jgi:polysaccharide deacetylase family protein (PEP-CTERM system associated)